MGEIKADLIDANLSQGVNWYIVNGGFGDYVCQFDATLSCYAVFFRDALFGCGVSYCFDADKPRGSGIEAALKYLPSHHAYRNK